MSKRYIHYNSDAYNKERLKKALIDDKLYRRYDKPHGLWASPVNTEIGWKEWCEAEDFNVDRLEKSFEFTLLPEAKVLTITKLEDIDDFILVEDGLYGPFYLNLPLIYNRYDAMEVIVSNNWIRFHDTNIFYSWDVDSICVWNPDIIVV